VIQWGKVDWRSKPNGTHHLTVRTAPDIELTRILPQLICIIHAHLHELSCVLFLALVTLLKPTACILNHDVGSKTVPGC